MTLGLFSYNQHRLPWWHRGAFNSRMDWFCATGYHSYCRRLIQGSPQGCWFGEYLENL